MMKNILDNTILVFLFSTTIGFSQDSWICNFGSENIQYKNVLIEPLNDKKITLINSLIKSYGIDKSFNVMSSVSINSVVSIGGLTGAKSKRLVVVPSIILDTLLLLPKQYIPSVAFFHSISHHINRPQHINNKEISIIEELEADEFAGYHLNKLGWSIEKSIETLIAYFPKKNLSTYKPKTEQRLLAFRKGWQRRENESKLAEQELLIQVYKQNRKREDSIIATTTNNTNPLKMAKNYLLAYKHSGAKNPRLLYYAFKGFLKAKEFNIAALCGNQLLNIGAGFLSKYDYNQFIEDLSQSFINILEYNKAIRLLKFGQNLDSSTSNISYLLSIIYRRQGNSKKYIEALKRSIIKGPASASLYFELAEALKDNNASLEALKYYNRILAIEPENINARIALADFYILKGQNSPNNSLLTKTNYPDFENQHDIKLEFWDKAENLLIDGLRNNPNNPILKKELKKLKQLKENYSINNQN